MAEENPKQSRRTILKRAGTAAALGAVGFVGTASAESDPVVETWGSYDSYAWGFSANADLEDLGGADSIDVYIEARVDGTSSWDHRSSKETFYSAPADFEHTITGLEPDTYYEYRAVGEASDGDVATGEIKHVPLPEDTKPAVSLNSDYPAHSITDSEATLVGYIDSMGGADEIDVSFKYGKEGSSLDQTSSVKNFDVAPYWGDFAIEVSGLESNTTYEYRVFGDASDGESDRSDSTLTFTTE